MSRKTPKEEQIGLVELLVRSSKVLDYAACKLPFGEQTNAHDLAKKLRKAARYHQPNPLGGPARVFDAMADRLRAGEPYDDVLDDFGFKPAARRLSGEIRKARSSKQVRG